MKYALLIGCNYTSVPGCTLHGCIDDVVNMKAMLTSHLGYDPANVVVLRDDAATASARPTRANILAALTALCTASTQSACREVWVHYSGHGAQVMEGRVLDATIVPLDFQTAGFIDDNLLAAFVARIRCPAVMLFDSCFSGTICELEWSFVYVSGSNFQRTQNNGRVLTNPNLYTISGCKTTQTAADIYDGEAKEYEGAFTDAFLRSMAKEGYSAPIGRIVQDVSIWLKQHGFTQIPVLSSSTPAPAYTLCASPSTSTSTSTTVSTSTSTSTNTATGAIRSVLRTIGGIRPWKGSKQ